MSIYEVWCPDLGHSGPEDGASFNVDSRLEAAEYWARWNDHRSAEYAIVGGTDYEVCVRDPSGKTSTFIVSGESVPVYRARLKIQQPYRSRPMTDLKQKTEHFLALADAATPGRWFDHGDTVWAPPDSDDEGSTCVAQECTNEDAVFIAAAPEMATHLCALQAENDRLQAQLEVAHAASEAAVRQAQWQATTNRELNELQAECEALRVDAEPWIYTSEKLHPDKPGLESYEQIPCVILKNREISLKVWNCEHLVWDDETGDDFYCAASDVTAWKIVRPPAMRAAMNRERGE